MATPKKDLNIIRGQKWELVVTEQNEDNSYVDFTNVDVVMHLKTDPTQSDPDFVFSKDNGNVVIEDVLDPVSLENVGGRVCFRLTPAETDNLTFDSAFYDIYAAYIPGVDHDYILQGKINVSTPITRHDSIFPDDV